MAIAMTLQQYLDNYDIDYEVLSHLPTFTSKGAARAAHIPLDRFVKPVVLEDETGYLMALVPATHQIEIGQLSRQLGRRLGLATEREVAMLFKDCEVGAIPPIGEAYGMDVVMDDTLAECPDVYFEGGDHKEVVHITGADFSKMMHASDHGRFSHPV